MSATTANSQELGHQGAPIRLLIVVNAIIPTVQLSLLAPLEKLIKSGECFIDFLTEQQIKDHFGKGLRTIKAQAWVKQRCHAAAPTYIVFCRYSGPHAEAILTFSRAQGLTSIYCIDDDLLNVPRELGQQKFEYHNHPLRLETVRYLMNNVDLVYCSNPRLEQRLRDIGINGNLHAGKIFSAGEIISPAELRPVRTIGYMGFDHAHDFEIVIPALVNVMRQRPELHFELFGKIPKPAALDEFKERIVMLPVVPNYDEFMRVFSSRNWDIGICPLAPTDFNRVKNINKWIEYTAVGAAVIGTQSMIYDECCADGCGLLVGDNDWESALMTLIECPEKRFEQVRNAQCRLSEEYSVEQLREQIQGIFAIASEKTQLQFAPVK
jgi:glycosyltransferase involved in cell wall biosynthesis